MFIQTETTPNPQTIKFIPGQILLSGEPLVFNRGDTYIDRSPLAGRLLAVEGVLTVFLASDFISITKEPDVSWDIVKPTLLSAMMDHFVSGLPVLIENGQFVPQLIEEDYDPADKELVAQIKELIETRVRPSVAQDGGDIQFRGFREGVVQLSLHGACSGCPSSSITLKNGIETMLKYYVPEIIAVEAV
jgi:Fe-S cluster biogenesis protein NfuA